MRIGIEAINERFFPKILYRHTSRLISDVSRGFTHFRIKVLQNFSNNENNLMEAGEYDITLKEIQIPKRSKIKKFFLEDPQYIERLINGNLSYLKEIESETINFIKKTCKKYSKYQKITRRK